MDKMDIGTVNALSYEDFVDILGNVVEKCPVITAAVWSRRPFANLSALEAAINDFIDALPESGRPKEFYNISGRSDIDGNSYLFHLFPHHLILF